MRSVKYVKATSWGQASDALKRNAKARPIAGGSDVLGWIKEGIEGKGEPRWDAFVDIRTIKGSDEIKYSNSGLTIGALATLDAIESSEDIQKNYPALAKAAGAAAAPNIRHVGTIGGNINQRPRCWYLRNAEFNCYKKGGEVCFAVAGNNTYHAILGGEKCFIVHPSDTAPALMALGAEAVISTPGGEKTVSFEKYFIGPREDILHENILKQGDLLTQIKVPALKDGTGMSFIKAQRRGQTYDFALASVASVITKKDGKVSESRIVLSGVAPTPWRATAAEEMLKGKAVDAALAGQAADEALKAARPMTNNAYKIGLAKTLIVRSIMEAFA
ncbi:MAG TPA: FAD binding domain-containing protein [Dehalococcoidia bacterium]|nr:FAD binding domain-containing protein [Dehalococcoidia bacterium]